MRDLVLTPRPRRQSPTVTRTAIATVRTRSLMRPVRPTIVRPETRSRPDHSESDPYGDYGRYLTAQGGILIIYKGFDDRWRHTLWQWFAWTLFTAPEAWLALKLPIETDWVRYACCAAVAIINAIIVGKPVEMLRRIEIRPDCLILDNEKKFWLRLMESLPSFSKDEDDKITLSGIYGTRFIEYLTVHRFDDNDRTPEVLNGGFQDAIRQLWSGRP